jgi:hypothetical protein
MIGVALRARASAAERRKPFECMRAAYGEWAAWVVDHGRSRRARTRAQARVVRTNGGTAARHCRHGPGRT